MKAFLTERDFANIYDHPDWPEATVRLIDAMRDYIRALDDTDLDAQIEGWEITPEQRRKADLHRQAVRLLLKELEAHEVGCGGSEIEKLVFK